MGSIDQLSLMQPTCQLFVRKWRGIVFSQWINDELFANKNLSRVDIQRCLHGSSIASSYVAAQNGQSSVPSVSSAPSSSNSRVGSLVVGLASHAAPYQQQQQQHQQHQQNQQCINQRAPSQPVHSATIHVSNQSPAHAVNGVIVSVNGNNVSNINSLHQRNNPRSPNRKGNFGGSMNSSNFTSNWGDSRIYDHTGYQNGSNMKGHNNINVNATNRQKFASLSSGGPERMARYGPNGVAARSMTAVNINVSENKYQNYLLSGNNTLGAGGIESNTNTRTSVNQND